MVQRSRPYLAKPFLHLLIGFSELIPPLAVPAEAPVPHNGALPYTESEAPPVSAIQNTRAPSEFLTTSIPKQKPWILLIFAKTKTSKLKVCRFLSIRAKLR